jgi:DNA-directed RNA polymerase specialized sigma24 family protein
MTASKPRPRRRHARSSADVIKVAILRLPTKLRDVFVLHRFGGMTYDEIGLHLGIPPEAVKAMFAAALVRLARTVRISERRNALKLTRLRKGIIALARSAPGCGGL